jgi:fructokinase
VRETARFETTTPAQTLAATQAWLQAAAARHGSLAAIGIASFGPAELDRASPLWGHITATPKPGWSHTPLAPVFAEAFSVPVGFDTDVNGAALAEARWGAGQHQRLSIYLTIGTGIGGGIFADGKILHGLSHPEMGHYRPQRHPDDLDFTGICPFHGDCLEGLANGPAIKARWGKSLSELPADHPGHDIIAFYLAQVATTLQAILEPGRIIFGGGVMATPGLMARVRARAVQLGAGYFKGKADAVIVPPGLGDRAGLLGALALAQEAIGRD